MKETFWKLHPAILSDTNNVISSPVLAVGPWPFDTLASPIVNPFGVVHVHASPFPQPDRKLVLLTNGTYGPHGTASFASAGLQSSLESRLRMQFGLDGLTRFSVTLKKINTPAGLQLCQLTRSALTMSAKDYIGLPTPCARDTQDLSRFGPFKASMARRTHSLTTHLLALGVPWEAVSLIYCLVMGLSVSVEQRSIHQYGNAIVPQAAAAFIRATLTV